MGNIRAFTSAREILLENLFLSHMTCVIAENAKPPSTEAILADMQFYDRHADWTEKNRLLHTANLS